MYRGGVAAASQPTEVVISGNIDRRAAGMHFKGKRNNWSTNIEAAGVVH